MLPLNDSRRTPTYDLAEVQRLVGQGPISCKITTAAASGARELGLVPADIITAVLALSPADFHKSMPATTQPGLWQDVYRHRYGATTLYIKVQVSFDGFAIVIQCKEM